MMLEKWGFVELGPLSSASEILSVTRISEEFAEWKEIECSDKPAKSAGLEVSKQVRKSTTE